MKTFLLGLVLGILVASVPLAYTQQDVRPSSPPGEIDFSKPPERISIGAATLWLGMEEKAAISKVSGLGYKLTKTRDSSDMDGWIIAEKNEQTGQDDVVVASLSFEKGRLIWASREWAASNDAGSARVGRNLYFLMKSLQDSGNTTCSIEAASQESPDFVSKDSILHCGRRTITLGVAKYKELREETQLAEMVRLPR